MSAELVIEARGLRKSYGDFEAVRGIDLEVERGEVFAFLGPNGAGKTTTVEMLEGYRSRSAGEAKVLGVDPGHPTRAWRERVGIVLQECRLPPELTVRESVAEYAGYYAHPRDVEETLTLVGLAERADVRSGRLSGGQRRRLDVALALIGDPDLLFLDEPTTGFDPSARQQAWHVVAGLRDLGKTIFLTTHYMEEAQNLADRVAIIAAGQIVAQGKPDELGGSLGSATTISFRLPATISTADLPESVSAAVRENGAGVTLEVAEPLPVLRDLTAWACERGCELDGLEVRRPSLEDVYLDLTTGVEDTRGEPTAAKGDGR